MDFRGESWCGSVLESNIEEIWNGKYFQAARRFLYHGYRTFYPCSGCDAVSYRSGFLPDKKGLEYSPEPKAKDEKIVEELLKKGPCVERSKLPWE